jgi:hypothetical protein
LSTEWSEAKQHRKDAQKSAAEIGLAYVEAGLEDSRQESKKQGLKTLVDKLRWKIKYEDLAQGEGFRSRIVLTKPEGDTVELEWSEAKQASVL